MAQNPGVIKARGVAGAFYLVFGVVIAIEIVHKTRFSYTALPGVALGGAMFALGIVRIRAALTILRAPRP